VSIEAITWALNDAPIPADRRDASSLAAVLFGLANHADPDGQNAFPAVATLVRYTRLSPRTVQYALRALEELHLIRPSDPDIIAAYLKRADRRPNGWDLAIHSSIHRVVHNRGDGVQALHPDPVDGVQVERDGVQTTTSRGATTAPEPSLNRPKNPPARDPAPDGRDGAAGPQSQARRAVRQPGRPFAARNLAGRSAAGRGEPEPSAIPPVCGQCDARPTDPISARIIWLDADRTRSRRCPQCHPHAGSNGFAGDIPERNTE
jgi:hypothetical protein